MRAGREEARALGRVLRTRAVQRLLRASLALLPLASGCGTRAVSDFYATRPPFERPISEQRIPRGLKSLSSRECGSCHVEIYREWRQSVHAQAWTDRQFQAELRKQPGVRWLCVNCHTPLRNQIDSLVVTLADGDVERPVRRANTAYDRGLRLEGVTCAACHVREGAVEGPFGDPNAPHAVRLNPSLRSPELCLGCHQAVQAYPGKNFVCTFRTGDEWREGPLAAAGRICQDCHMPVVHRSLVAGGPARRSGRHSWIGSHLMKGGESNPALWDSLAALTSAGIALLGDREPRAIMGDSATWTVCAVNAFAGHRLPTGDPERSVIVRLVVLAEAGDTLASLEHVVAQRYQWWPEVKQLSDDRLAPGETDSLTIRYRTPHGRYRLVAWAVNERINDANAEYHHLPATYVRRAEVARVERYVTSAR